MTATALADNIWAGGLVEYKSRYRLVGAQAWLAGIGAPQLQQRQQPQYFSTSRQAVKPAARYSVR